MMTHVDPTQIYCVGCTACMAVCPKDAITMVENRAGFFAPEVDAEKCISCGKCVKICPAQNTVDERKPMKQFAGWNNDEQVRYDSTSGGIFAALAKTVLDQGGIVYGAAYSNDFTEVFHTNSDEVELRALQKSKYAVSNLKNTFLEIQNYIKQDRKVLFVGTPCQCAGLRNVVGQNENILLVDFICGGTPSAKAFREYINYKKKKTNAEITRVDFRGKDTGWKKQYLRIDYANGKKENTFYLYDPYFSLFCIEHLTTRQACAQCQFRKRHVSDLTIADFWGWRNADIPEDDRGLSLVAVNTTAGESALESAQSSTLYPLSYSQIQYAYEEFPKAQEMLERKIVFLEDLEEHNFCEIHNKYVKTDRISVFLRRVLSKLKR